MGKTDTIKQRTVYVYLPSRELVDRWNSAARSLGTSVSKFVIEHVENSLRQEEETDFQSRGDLFNEIKKLREDLQKIKKENRILDQVVEKLEKEVRRYRAQPFLEDDFTGVRQFQKELVEILKRSGVVGNEEILSRLDIDPFEQEAVKAVLKQLELLQDYGLVKSTPRGWRWIK